MILSRLLTLLKHEYGEEWVDVAPETVTLDLGVIMDPLTLQSFYMLQALHNNTERFGSDASYFLAYIQTSNNKVIYADLPYVPTSLEIAWALHDLARIVTPQQLLNITAGNMLRKICTFVLREEGFSTPVPPFDKIVLTKKLYDGESAADVSNKAKAIRLYIAAMEKSNGEC